MIKIQIKSIFGKVIFEYEKDNNTMLETLLKALSEGADLEGANLEGANLYGANLEGAYLRRANLRRADLRRADLEGANLEGANLYGANLEGAYLRRANLEGAYLRRANLEGAYLEGASLRRANLEGANLEGAYLYGAENLQSAQVPMYCKWSFSIVGDKIKIGCKEKTIEEWDSWFSGSETFSTERNTEDFKRIQAVYEGMKSYYNFLKS